jgi:hypothetical protein
MTNEISWILDELIILLFLHLKLSVCVLSDVVMIQLLLQYQNNFSQLFEKYFHQYQDLYVVFRMI